MKTLAQILDQRTRVFGRFGMLFKDPTRGPKPAFSKLEVDINAPRNFGHKFEQ